MPTIRDMAKRLPLLPAVYRALRDWRQPGQARRKSAAEVFTEIYRSNRWGGTESVSGTGSDLDQTRKVAAELPGLLADFRVATMLDIPCGDFHWMRHVALGGVDYTGADIVEELVRNNQARYGNAGVHFRHLDLIKDRLPRVDLIFCRDCLVHLCYADIRAALRNICDSQSEYLLATTFVDRETNRDIVTGQWRELNLLAAPFNLPAPLRVIDEGCTEYGGIYNDKSLALWRVADIRESLAGS